MGRLCRPGGGPAMVRERIETEDGDFLDIDVGEASAPGAPVVLVLHGLEGSSRRRYVRNLCRELGARGVTPVAMNLRGCSGEPNRHPRFYHSGETGDPVRVIELLRERYPDSRIGAMGFSLGGNMLLKLMGERPDGGRGLLDAAAVMSVPFDLHAGSRRLEGTRAGRFYARYFLRSLRLKVRGKADKLRDLVNVEDALAAPTLRRFDDVMTAPLHGFRDSLAYYRECSSRNFVSGIRVPCLLLHSADDPLLPREAVPVDLIQKNPLLRLRLLEAGGHVGFMAGSPWRPSFWGDAKCAAFLAETLTG